MCCSGHHAPLLARRWHGVRGTVQYLFDFPVQENPLGASQGRPERGVFHVLAEDVAHGEVDVLLGCLNIAVAEDLLERESIASGGNEMSPQ